VATSLSVAYSPDVTRIPGHGLAGMHRAFAAAFMIIENVAKIVDTVESNANTPNGISAARGSSHRFRRINASCSFPHSSAALSESNPDSLPNVPSGRR
jgi:hypothetical protein